MRTIKGLIAKDLANLSHYKKTLFIVIIIFCGISIYQSDFYTILPVVLTTMVGMIGLSVFSYDEIAKSDKYMLTLPTTRKEMVKAKYILIMGLTIVGAILGTLVSYFAFYFLNHQMPNLMETLITGIGGLMGITIVESIQIPSIYKWGAEKGRIQMFIMIIIVTAILGGLFYLLGQQYQDMDMSKVINFIQKMGVIVFIIIMSISYYISYRISLKIYQNKEL